MRRQSTPFRIEPGDHALTVEHLPQHRGHTQAVADGGEVDEVCRGVGIREHVAMEPGFDEARYRVAGKESLSRLEEEAALRVVLLLQRQQGQVERAVFLPPQPKLFLDGSEIIGLELDHVGGIGQCLSQTVGADRTGTVEPVHRVEGYGLVVGDHGRESGLT